MLCRFVLACAAISSAGFAATLGGRIFDPSGAVVPGARVQAFDEAGKNQLAPSGPDGQYSFSNLFPGVYRIEVQTPGFAMFVQRNVNVAEGQQPRVDATLRVGQMMEWIHVESQGTPNLTQVPQKIRVGGNVRSARLLRQMKPEYPDAAKARGATGIVMLRAIILKSGEPTAIVPYTNSDPDLAKAAMEAVKQWRYEPTLLNGEPVETDTTISIQFDLK